MADEANPAANHERRAIEDLRYHPDNARTHSDEQLTRLARSVEQYGQARPILVDEDGTIIAGHGTVMALERNGAESAWVSVATGWDESTKRAYRLADNRLADKAGWDYATLADELAALVGEGVDYDAMGFDRDEIASLIGDDAAGGGPTDPNAEWEGMPEYEHGDEQAYRTIKVHFVDEDAVEQFEQLTGKRLTENTQQLWFPETPIRRMTDKEYADDEGGDDEQDPA